MGAIMTKIVAGAAAAALATGAGAETVNFDADPAGAIPAGWVCGSTGGNASDRDCHGDFFHDHLRQASLAKRS